MLFRSVPVDCKVIYGTTNFTNDYTISKNFSLGMLIDGGVTGKHKLMDQVLKNHQTGEERVYTVQEIVCNLAQLAQNVLEPYIELLPGGIGGYKKQWTITSGYRLKGVEKNESPTSDHCKGHCIDIDIILPDKFQKTYDIVQQIERAIPYDQIILEYRYPDKCWIHISYRKDNNRRMAFTMVNDSTYKRNSAGLPYGFYLLDSIPPKSK